MFKLPDAPGHKSDLIFQFGLELPKNNSNNRFRSSVESSSITLQNAAKQKLGRGLVEVGREILVEFAFRWLINRSIWLSTSAVAAVTAAVAAAALVAKLGAE